MKILIATPLYPPDIGGPATYAKALETELPKRGVLVSVLSFHTVRYLPKGIAHIVYMAKLLRALRGVDIILALDPVSVGFPVALTAILRRKKFVIRIVGDYAWEQGSQRFGVADNLDEFVKKPSREFAFRVRILRFVQTFVVRRAAKIIVPSKYLKHIVLAWGISSEKITVIHNGFVGVLDVQGKEECRHELRISGTMLLSAGRLVPWKRFGALVSVMVEILKKVSSAKLYIAGVGPDETFLVNRIKSLSLEDSVIMLGNVEREKLMKYIRAADCFVLNTGYEGFSHQLLEVLAIGTPIVTTRVGGNPELIEDGKTGFLVSCGATPGELGDAILRVLSEKGTREKFSANGKVLAASFTVNRMVKETVDILQAIILRP